MISVVQTKQGKSFRGLVAYLMEGSKGQENPERVGWTETQNLATRRPMMAAKVMAATALDQARLKDKAGISNAGRKSKNHVLHYTLSWAEWQEVSREEMMRAVNGSLAVLGEKAGQKGGRNKKAGRVAARDQFASEHQVLVVSHEDTDNAHVHVVVNRVHPGHGVMLPAGHDFKMLSRWAEKYELENGGIIVDQRAINNAARDRGESVPSQKRAPRDVYELEAGVNDNRPPVLEVRTEQRAKDAALAKQSKQERDARKQQWVDFSEAHRLRKAELREGAGERIARAAHSARNTFTDDWATLYYEHKVATTAFERSEEHIAGQAINALKALLSLRAPVNVLWSRGARKMQLEKAQKGQERELAARQRAAGDRAAEAERAKLQADRALLTHRFTRERAELILKHRTAAAVLREKWATRKVEREQAWTEHRKAMEALPPEKRFGAQMIAADERTKTALSALDRMREAAKQRDQDRKEGRDEDRGR
ncbi:MAG: relaxase/mobilization nuclease domain-containing protein [Planctomycetota bacterium]